MPKKKENYASPFVPESEQPYKVPENWCWVRFGTVCRFENGYAFKSDNFSTDMGTPVIRITNIKDNEIDLAGCVYSLEKNIDPRFVVEYGDLLIAMSGATTGKNGIYKSNTVAYLNQRVGNIKVIDEKLLLPLFRNFFIQSKQEEILNNAYGGAQPNISNKKIEKMPTPLPPLPEQQRIVERIESLFAKLDEARDKVQAVIDSLELSRMAILHRAFTGELTARWRKEHGVGLESWERLKIGEFAEVKGGKRLPKGHELQLEQTKHPYLRITDFGDMTIDCSGIHYISNQTFKEISRYIINKDDVYISIVGSIGKVGTIPEHLSGANLTENAARIITNRTHPRYLVFYLSSSAVQENIRGRIRSATLGKLSLLNIKDISVQIPPLAEQAEIVRILDDLLTRNQQARDAAEAVMSKIEIMKKAILARAFRGELGTNRPEEESAEKLIFQCE